MAARPVARTTGRTGHVVGAKQIHAGPRSDIVSRLSTFGIDPAPTSQPARGGPCTFRSTDGRFQFRRLVSVLGIGYAARGGAGAEPPSSHSHGHHCRDGKTAGNLRAAEHQAWPQHRTDRARTAAAF